MLSFSLFQRRKLLSIAVAEWMIMAILFKLFISGFTAGKEDRT